MRKYSGIDKDGNTTYQSVWDEATAVLRQKFTPINTYTKKTDLISTQTRKEKKKKKH